MSGNLQVHGTLFPSHGAGGAGRDLQGFTMKKEDTFRIEKERKAALIAEIKTYFSVEREEDIGDLAAEIMYDFIIEKMAPEFYNQGVEDACAYMKDAAEDLMSIRK